VGVGVSGAVESGAGGPTVALWRMGPAVVLWSRGDGAVQDGHQRSALYVEKGRRW
jgi:hypothetical protein